MKLLVNRYRAFTGGDGKVFSKNSGEDYTTFSYAFNATELTKVVTNG